MLHAEEDALLTLNTEILWFISHYDNTMTCVMGEGENKKLKCVSGALRHFTVENGTVVTKEK